MLTEVIIHNYILIQKARFHLTQGLNILTGETGSGKSLIISAILFAIGDHNPPKTLQHEDTFVELLFDLGSLNQNHALHQILKENKINVNNNQLSIKRSLNAAANKSQYTLNNKNIKLKPLKTIKTILLNHHGQFAHQLLLNPTIQLDLLDQFAHSQQLKQTVADIFHRHYSTKQQLALVEKNTASLLKQQHNRHELEKSIETLRKLNLQDNEVNQLEQELQSLENVENQIHTCLEINNIITESQNSLLNETYKCTKQLTSLTNHTTNTPTPLQTAIQLLDQVMIELQETTHYLNDHISYLNNSPHRIQQIKTRLSLIYDMARKYKTSPNDLTILYHQFCDQLKQFTLLEHQKKQLTEQLTEQENSYLEAAAVLSQHRQKAAKDFASKITQNLQKLAMEYSQFDIMISNASQNDQLNSYTFHESGMDHITFLIKTNLSQKNWLAIDKVASGGELARISLAIIESYLSKNKNHQTWLFDEIDIGIGGNTLATIITWLKKIAKEHTIICVTHQPHIAASADQHWSCLKDNLTNQTTTTVKKLDTQEKRIHEIARMIGCGSINQTALAHAKEIINKQQSN